MSRALADAEARRQVTTELGRNLFVEAGAGSGKTSSLVDRIVNLVASGAPVNQIAAITFTEAAARELRTRVRDELERRGNDGGDHRLITAAGEVESAAFTTLHGFALRLLSDHPVEAGLPPGFGVADEITTRLDFDDAWHLFTSQIGDDLALLDLQERASVLNAGLYRFVEVARRFDDNWDLVGLVDHDPPPLSPLDLADLVDEVVALGELARACIDPADKLAEPLLALAAEAEAHRKADPLDQLDWLRGVQWRGTTWGKRSNWARIDVEEARRRLVATKERVEAEIERYVQEVLDHWVAHVASFVERRVEARQAAGELAYHDLLVLARQLLRRDRAVRERLHQRYTRILLDEFQDTDPIQIELAVLLATGEPVDGQQWQELASGLDGGRLVLMGDPKQSIYRFRRADMQVYADTEASLVDDATRLTTNFRSVPGIVEFVNRFFGHVIGDGEPGAQPGYTPLAPFRPAEPGKSQVPVVAFGGPHDKTVPVGEIREIEAADVAALVCRAVEEWRTERDGQWLPLRLADIAVLIPSRLSLPALESAFGEANVPFRPETSSLVYATQEVRDVLAGVRAVVDPSNEIDVVAALRSGLFAIGDDDLLSWHLAGGTWDYRAGEQPDGDSLASHRVAEALAVLAAWHRDRWWTEPSALIERIVRERRLREAALAEPRPRDRWRRYRFLAEQARQFTSTSGGDLHDFVAWVEVQASDLARVTEPVPAEPDDDAVRVLTVHGSKGLEFPMVILAGAPTAEQGHGGGPQVLFPPGEPPQTKLSRDASTAQFDLHASVEEVLDRHERVRLHYVAATRARDVLAVSAHHKDGTRSGGLRTWGGLQACDGLWRTFERRGDERYSVEPPTQLRLVGGSHAELEATWTDEQRRLLGNEARHRTRSATTLAEVLARLPSPAHPVPERQAWRQGKAGSAVGSAVHATLQVLDLDVADLADIDRLATLNAKQEQVPELAGEVASLVRAALRAPSVDLARQYRHWRELYVAAPIGHAQVEGFIDLCVDTPDGLVIIDYKTDPVTTGQEADERARHYRPQAATYALALETITGRPVAGCRFVFIGPAGVIERQLDDLTTAQTEIRTHLDV